MRPAHLDVATGTPSDAALCVYLRRIHQDDVPLLRDIHVLEDAFSHHVTCATRSPCLGLNTESNMQRMQ